MTGSPGPTVTFAEPGITLGLGSWCMLSWMVRCCSEDTGQKNALPSMQAK